MIEIRIPIRTSNPCNGGQGRHWAVTAKKRRTERHAAWVCLRQQTAPALPCIVTLVRIAPRALDLDNLRPALKSVRDEVAVWLGLPLNARGHAEDADPRVHWAYQQGKGSTGEYAVLVRAETVTQAEVDQANSAEEYRP